MSGRNLTEQREKIDTIDEKIIKLLTDRAKTALRIGQIKKQGSGSAYAPEREQKVLTKILKKNKGPFPEEALKNIYSEVLSACRALQAPLSVAYLGPEATYTHAASLKKFGRSTEMLAQNTISGVFDSVEAADVPFGVVPVENSTEGMVTHTLDRLLESPLFICGEILLEISHSLLGHKKGVRPQQIYSHAQATAQCRSFLERYYADVPVRAVSSTAMAAQLVSNDPSSYAIGSELAGQRYGLKVLKSHIEDHRGNMTRFLVIGKEMPKKSGNDKSSLVFSVRDEVGILYAMLEPFHEAGINLSKIESRPMVRLDAKHAKKRAQKNSWEYAFFVDLEGHIETAKVKRAVAALEKKCQFLKVLGSYPKGQ
jgi:chorismate mutase / prephenate dehydratase